MKRGRGGIDAILHAYAMVGMGEANAGETLAGVLAAGMRAVGDVQGPGGARTGAYAGGDTQWSLAREASLELVAMVCAALGPQRTAARWCPNPRPLRAVAMGANIVREVRRREYHQALEAEPAANWYVELPDAGRKSPRGVALWRRDRAGGERWMLAGVWTRGLEGASAHPTMVIEEWNMEAGTRVGEVIQFCGQDEQARDPGEARVMEVRERMTDTIMGCVGAALAHSPPRRERALVNAGYWNRAVAGARAKREPARALAREMARRHIVECVALGPLDAGRSPIAAPRTALECVVAAARRTAREEGHNIALSTPLGTHWTEEAELGAIVWHARNALAESEDAVVRYGRAAPESTLERPCVFPGAALRTLMSRTIAASGGAAVYDTKAYEPLEAVLVPAKTWADIAAAGPPPQDTDPFGDGSEHRAWYLEIERPAKGEPAGYALWWDEAEERATVMGIWTEGPGASREAPRISAFKIGEKGSGARVGTVRLGRGDAQAKEGRAASEVAGAALQALTGGTPSLGTRAMAAAHEQRLRLAARMAGETPPQPQRWAAPAPTEPGRAPAAAHPDGLFAIARMEPAPGPPAAQGAGTTRASDAARAVRERHWVRAHWKRQRYGPQGKRRKVVLIESYERGPAPGAEQIVMLRMREDTAGNAEKRKGR